MRSLRRGEFAAPENQNGCNDAHNGQNSPKTHNFENRGTVGGGTGIVLIAEEQHAIDGRADLARGGIHETEAYVAAWILDAIEVARDSAIRREDKDAAGVREQTALRKKIIAKIRGLRGSVDGFFGTGKKMPAAGGSWATEVFEGALLFFRGHGGVFARVKAHEHHLVILTRSKRQHF